MQKVKTPYEIDDTALLNLLFPPEPTQQEERPADHLTEAEAEDIFRLAEEEIQPILRDFKKWRRKDLLYGLAEFLCFCIFLSSLAGIVWQCITYPHTLVLLYTQARPATITTPLDLPTRTLAPVTITRSATRATTGTGYQDATRATGTLTFYNGLSTVQSVPATVFTGRDGVQITFHQTVEIPTAIPPQFGMTTVTATATSPGAAGNIPAYDVSTALSSSLTVKNVTSFTGGQNARTYRAVAAKDIATLNTTVNGALTQAFTTAFTLQPDQAAIPTNCHVTTSASHQIGEEAQSVTLTGAKTCSAIAYSQSQLTRAATAAFTETRPRARYHLVSSLQTSLISVTPLTVRLSGKWAFTFSQGYQDYLAEQIQGDDPQKARAYLLNTGVVSYASVPNRLASAEYINFLVLVG